MTLYSINSKPDIEIVPLKTEQCNQKTVSANSLKIVQKLEYGDVSKTFFEDTQQLSNIIVYLMISDIINSNVMSVFPYLVLVDLKKFEC